MASPLCKFKPAKPRNMSHVSLPPQKFATAAPSQARQAMMTPELQEQLQKAAQMQEEYQQELLDCSVVC